MTEKRFTTVELPKPNKWGIWYDGAYLSTYQVCILLNEYVDVKNENKQLKHFIQELTTKGTAKIHLANGSIYKVNAILNDFKCDDLND